MTTSKFFNILFMLATVFVFSGLAMAQDNEPRNYSEAISKSQKEGSQLVFDPILGTQKKDHLLRRNQKDERYAKTTYENLSKMYWAIHALNLHDNEAIDNYLRINECDLWEKYYHNDFQWEEIRAATKKVIAKERHNFPMKFEILLPLSLGRYDVEREVFYIEDITKFKNMKKIDIALAPQNFVCYSGGFLEGYPGTTILILDRPFHFVEIPVKPELARLYIREAEERYSNMSTSMKIYKYERQAYLRVLVSFNSYVNTVIGAGGVKKAVVHAKIDAVEVYADSQNTKPLYIKDFSEVRKRRKHRVLDDMTNSDIDRALKGLLSSSDEEDTGNYLQ